VALAPHRLPRSSQTRVASQTGLRALLDEAELLGSAAPSPATAGGSITLGGTDNGQARAPAVAAGVVLFGGSATAQARTTAAGSISLGGAVGASAPAAASGSISLSGAATGTPVGSSNVQYVGGSTTNSGASAVTSMAITGPSAPSTFAIFYASRASGTATGAMTGVTDTAGNTWVRATRGGVSGASNTRIEIWYCENYTPATTITGAGPSFVSAWGVAGFSGLVNASSLDVTTADYSVGSTATTITAPSITTSQSDLIFAADSHTTDATGALQSPFTQLSTYSLSGGGGGQAGYLIAPTAGTYTATWTQSTASSVGCHRCWIDQPRWYTNSPRGRHGSGRHRPRWNRRARRAGHRQRRCHPRWCTGGSGSCLRCRRVDHPRWHFDRYRLGNPRFGAEHRIRGR
jgi:hypothetical protein